MSDGSGDDGTRNLRPQEECSEEQTRGPRRRILQLSIQLYKGIEGKGD